MKKDIQSTRDDDQVKDYKGKSYENHNHFNLCSIVPGRMVRHPKNNGEQV